MNAKNDFSIYGSKLAHAKQFMENAVNAWKEVFPYSSSTARSDDYGNFVIFHGYLSENPKEYESSLLSGDPLCYVGVYYGETLGYREMLVGVSVKSPSNEPTVYHCSKLEAIAMREPSYRDLFDRFHDVRRLVLNSRDGLQNLSFNVNQKLGV